MFELLVLYGALPVVFAVAAQRYGYRGAMAPMLWLVSAALTVVLARDPRFDTRALFHVPAFEPYVRAALVRFCLLAVALLVLGRWLAPAGFLWLPRQRPGLFALFVCLYPLLSALPQGIIWRVFFVHRYAALFPDRLSLLCAGAAAFSLAHLAFWNLTALAVTALGGALFLHTYLQTQSLTLSTLEHGAYGIVAFCAGFGAFLYRGARAVSQRDA